MKYHSELLRRQIARTIELRTAAETLNLSGRMAFDIVEERVNGVMWRCLFGQYRAQFWPDLPFEQDALAEWFGLSLEETARLFGANVDDYPLVVRRMLIDAHIDELRQKLRIAEGRTHTDVVEAAA